MSLRLDNAANLALALDNANAIDAEVSELLGLPPTHAGILSAALLKARLTELAIDEAHALINSMQITATEIRQRALDGQLRTPYMPKRRMYGVEDNADLVPDVEGDQRT